MLRRIRAVLHKSMQSNGHGAEIALGALEQLVTLADKAQIPLIGGGFSVVAELIQTFQVSAQTSSAPAATG